MTDPIGTAQERELDLRMSLEALESGDATIDETFNDINTLIADALQSPIAEVGRLETALREIVVVGEELGRIDEDGEHWLTTAEVRLRQIASAALSLHRRPT